ncbi:DNA polymerase kappa, partial [Globisporangium splendens]
MAEGNTSASCDGASAATSSAATEQDVQEANAPLPAADHAGLGRELFVFTAQKAGMSHVDKEHVEKVVYDMSKDSKFFQNSMKQNDKVNAKIEIMRAQLARLSTTKRDALQAQVDKLVVQLEAARDLTRTIVVVDMDMFYAAVEMRDNPKLREVPLAVGGLSMISTTNYIARKFGVRAAMPGFIGKELCPELVFVAPNFSKYKQVATQIREIFAEYDPHFSAFSLDEAKLDITEYMEAHWPRYCIVDHEASGDDAEGEEEEEESKHEDCQQHMKQARRVQIASSIVAEIRARIFQETALTASAGIAVNTMLAKIASDRNKPNGQFVVPFTRDSVVSFIQSQPVRKIGGIGKVMEKILSAALGIATGKDLFAHRASLFHVFTETKTAPWLLRTSLAIQEDRDAAHAERKSFSRERTFRNVSDPQALEKICADVCEMLAADMEKARTGAKTLTLKLKCADFSVRTRSVSFAATLQTKDELWEHAVKILRKELPLTLRLMGVRGSSLVPLGDRGSGAEKENAKRQLEIDRFTALAKVEADPTSKASNAESTDEDDGDGATISNGNVTATKKSDRHNTNMTNFATPLPKDATSDIVAAILDAERRSEAAIPPSSSLRRQGDGTNDTSSAGNSDNEPAGLSAASFQPCPICSKMINVGNAIAINTHVEACIEKQQKRRKRAAAAVSDEDPFQPCPICGEMLNTKNSRLVNTHMDACILTSDTSPAQQDKVEIETCTGSAAANLAEVVDAWSGPSSCFQPCPICGHMINASNLISVNTHIDACMSGVQSDDNGSGSAGVRKRRRKHGPQQHSIQTFFLMR